MNANLDLALSFAVSAAIGLLVGTERERSPTAKAGLRTFALIAVLGSSCAWLGQRLESTALPVAGLLLVGAALIGSYLIDPRSRAGDAGITTVVAALLVYLLGALNFHGERVLAVALGVAITALLYFKTELEGIATRLTPTDIRSMLQFAAVAAIVLPLLPDAAYGPYRVLNPFHIGLMVVLIAGISLAGYVAWRLTLGHQALWLSGLLGGLVSSTATTLVYARDARQGTQHPQAAIAVIVLANAAMLARVLLLTVLLSPAVARSVALAIVPALLLAAPSIWRGLARSTGQSGDPAARLRNPTQLPAALAFAAGYALVLLAAAWLGDLLGPRGVLALAFASGLTDVDAITLSSLRMATQGSLPQATAALAITIAVTANLLFKAALTRVIAGAALGRAAWLAFAGPLAGMVFGILLAQRLA
jgi:uncharacterized membrane protein (DUF4010 family)